MHVPYVKLLVLPCMLILSGCVSDGLANAGKCFYREDYPGAIREINLFLGKSSDANGIESKSDKAIALFYRGMAKRACIIMQDRYLQNDYNESGRFRFGTPSGRNAAAADIIDDYKTAKVLRPDLVCADFHMALEHVLCQQYKKALECLSRFDVAVISNTIPNIEKQFDGEDIFKKSIELADSLRQNIIECNATALDGSQAKKVVQFYRDILFRKSKRHELHNIDLLTRKYSVANFKFLLESIDLESDYDYVDKTIECGADYLILRGSVGGNIATLSTVLKNNGFNEWMRCDDTTGIRIECKMGICVFEGNDCLPVILCTKRIDFGRVLVALYSCERQVLYCVVCKEDAFWFQRLSSKTKPVVAIAPNKVFCVSGRDSL